MPFPTKAHWTAILAIGLPLIVSGCTQTGNQDSEFAPTAIVAQRCQCDDVGAEAGGGRQLRQCRRASISRLRPPNPSNIDALLGMGDCYLAIGSLDNAALGYARALEVNPNSSRGLRGLGSARMMKGEPQFAWRISRRRCRSTATDTKALNTLGVTKDMLGKHSEAQAVYRRVLQINPGNYSAKNNLALSLALTGNHAESIKLLEEIASSTKSTPITKQNLALVYAAAGRTQDAMIDGALPAQRPGRLQQVAALENAESNEDKAVLLRRAFGIEFNGTQFVAPSQQIAVVTGDSGATRPIPMAW